MEDGAVFGGVDVLASKHRLNAGAEAAVFGKRHKSLHQARVNAVLRVVKSPACCGGGELLRTLLVGGEKLAQMRAACPLDFLFDDLPCLFVHFSSTFQKQFHTTKKAFLAPRRQPFFSR